MKRALTEATNMKRALTKTQSKILEFIVRYQREHNVTPSYREIANGCGLASSSTVHRNLATLKDLGIIKGGTNGKKDHRNIVVMLDNGEGNTTNAFTVPVLGRVRPAFLSWRRKAWKALVCITHMVATASMHCR